MKKAVLKTFAVFTKNTFVQISFLKPGLHCAIHFTFYVLEIL